MIACCEKQQQSIQPFLKNISVLFTLLIPLIIPLQHQLVLLDIHRVYFTTPRSSFVNIFSFPPKTTNEGRGMKRGGHSIPQIGWSVRPSVSANLGHTRGGRVVSWPVIGGKLWVFLGGKHKPNFFPSNKGKAIWPVLRSFTASYLEGISQK